MPLAELTVYAPRRGDRCYTQVESQWVPAVVASDSDAHQVTILVQGQPESQDRPVNSIRMCRKMREDDMVSMLKIHCFWSPSSYDRRRRMSIASTERLGSYGGLVGIASAGIQLLRHQIETISRVLDDKQVRFLIADEVGLGKTIQAGAIARQLLLDGALKIVIVVPNELLKQWTEELVQRFDLASQGNVTLIDFATFQREPRLTCDLLIVDEAHRLCESSTLYGAAETASTHADNLLLLSATPPSENTLAFTQLLHLVDPEHWHADDQHRLTALLTARLPVGAALVTLRCGESPRRLERAAKSVLSVFEDDIEGERKVAEFLSALDGEVPDEAGKKLLRLRAHISERYRLSRRIIRSARRSVRESLPFTRSCETSCEAPKLVAHSIQSEHRQWCSEWLDSWRHSVSEVAHQCLPELARACATSSLLLREYASTRLGESKGTGLLPSAVTTLTSTKPVGPELDLLRLAASHCHLDDIETEISEMAKVVANLNRKGSSVVVFTSDELLLDHFSKELSANGSDSFRVDELAKRKDRQGVLLLAQGSEEGLNLQFATDLVFLDVPWQFVRIEQRLGRVDRIGRSRPYTLHLFRSQSLESDIGDAVVEFLQDGLEVFHASISDIQPNLGSLSDQVLEQAMGFGATGIRRLIPGAKSRVTLLRNEVESIRALEEIEPEDEDGDALPRMTLSDQHFNQRRAAVEANVTSWGVTCLPNGTYRIPEALLLPDVARQSILDEVPFDSGAWTRQVLVAYDREVAQRTGCLVCGPGHPLFDTIAFVTDSLDDGRVFGVWRVVHKDAAVAVPVFGVDILVSFQEQALRSLSLPAVSMQKWLRRARRLFPTERVRYNFAIQNGRLTASSSDAIEGWANLHFDRRRDFPIGSKELSILRKMITAETWTDACGRVLGLGRDAARTGVKHRVEAATRILRSKLGGNPEDIPAWQAVEIGINDPTIAVDAVGFMVLTGRRPDK